MKKLITAARTPNPAKSWALDALKQVLDVGDKIESDGWGEEYSDKYDVNIRYRLVPKYGTVCKLYIFPIVNKRIDTIDAITLAAEIIRDVVKYLEETYPELNADNYYDNVNYNLKVNLHDQRIDIDSVPRYGYSVK